MYDEIVDNFNCDSASKYKIFYIYCELKTVTHHQGPVSEGEFSKVEPKLRVAKL